MNRPAYRLETERLVLRCWNPEDAALLKATVDTSINHLKPWMPWALHEPTDLAAKVERLQFCRSQFDTGNEFVYGIFNRDETQVLGGCGLHRKAGPESLEIGYWIGVEHIGKGLATETSRALVEAGFSVDGIDRIEIHHDPRNTRSRRIPEALGFELESIRRRDNTTFPGEFRDSMVWTLYRNQLPHSLPHIVGLDHVMVAIPQGSEASAREFYVGTLGLPEVEKPEELKKRGGLWVQCGRHQLHLGSLSPFSPTIKPHPAFEVLGLEALKRHWLALGVSLIDDEALPGAKRFYLADPFGNRLEFLEWDLA